VRRARQVRDGGARELVQAVEQESVSVSAAADVATLPKPRQAEIVARGEAEILQAANAIRSKRARLRAADHYANVPVIPSWHVI